ncbi:MAG: 30S ribosomal protein S6 [Planctomycetaceae bacterium]|nr:30S ribosomal protein S6 [Planctomycetaceae bacterium]
METAVKRMYEGMFLVDSALAAQDWQKVLDEVNRILNRASAEIVSVRKWDERRLCYDVNGKSRGTYILAYFSCETDKLAGIDRDIQLSEIIMRALVLKADLIKKEDMEKPTPAEINPQGEAPEGQPVPEQPVAAAPAAEEVA